MRTPLASAALGSLKRPRIAFCSSGDICVAMGVQVASRSQTRSGGWWYSRRSQKILPKHLPGHRGWQPGEPCRYRQGWCRRMLQYANVRWHEHHRIALRACPGTTYLATTLLERSLNKRKAKMEKRRQGEREDGWWVWYKYKSGSGQRSAIDGDLRVNHGRKQASSLFATSICKHEHR